MSCDHGEVVPYACGCSSPRGCDLCPFRFSCARCGRLLKIRRTSSRLVEFSDPKSAPAVLPGARHECHADGCSKVVPDRMLFCLPHWSMLPAEAKRIVWREYRPGQEADKRPSVRYLLVQAAAVALVAHRSRRRPTAEVLERLGERLILYCEMGLSVEVAEELLRAMGCQEIKASAATRAGQRSLPGI